MAPLCQGNNTLHPFYGSEMKQTTLVQDAKSHNAITFIEQYKYTIGFTYLPLKGRKKKVMFPLDSQG